MQERLDGIASAAGFAGWPPLVGDGFFCVRPPWPWFEICRVTPQVVWVQLVTYPVGL